MDSGQQQSLPPTNPSPADSTPAGAEVRPVPDDARQFGPMAHEALHNQAVAAKPLPQRYLLHALLFVLTYAAVTLTAVLYVAPVVGGEDALGLETLLQMLADNLPQALFFSTLLMLFLTAHEFGHYFTARWHGVQSTLPFYIPFPLFSPFGTMGAMIRIRSRIPSRRVLFDIGVAGPLAGFVVALAFLVIGIVTMPGIETVLRLHPEYLPSRVIPATGQYFGDFLLYAGLRELFVQPGTFFPPMNEFYHYPLLAVGWFGMFVTALNLLPFGQLDGGHIAYAMFGQRQGLIAKWAYRLLMAIGIGSVMAMVLDATRAYNSDGLYQFFQKVLGPPLEFVAAHMPWWLDGFGGWLIWAFLVRFVLKLQHPPVPDETPLSTGRMVLGWASFVVLVLIFPYAGMYYRP
jgi:membrane-associated protease RseP (regulator of RpoE activity)